MTEDKDVLEESLRRQRLAEELLDKLGLIELWAAHGRPVLVGALSYGLFYKPDLDMEIYCPEMDMGAGFAVFSSCVRNACNVGITVRQTLFQNCLDTPDQALYWQMRLEYAGLEWKADMWTAPEDYPLPRSEYMIEPMRKALQADPQRKADILKLKQARECDPSLDVPSIDIYRAVISAGVRTPDELRRWYALNRTDGVSDWLPDCPVC